jgi:hypothetical protein
MGRIEGRGGVVYKVGTMRSFPVWWAAVVAVFLVGCATTKIDWNSRMGSYTYDEAVAELGVPDRKETLTDGSIVAEWLNAAGWGVGAQSFFWAVVAVPHLRCDGVAGPVLAADFWAGQDVDARGEFLAMIRMCGQGHNLLQLDH